MESIIIPKEMDEKELVDIISTITKMVQTSYDFKKYVEYVSGSMRGYVFPFPIPLSTIAKTLICKAVSESEEVTPIDIAKSICDMLYREEISFLVFTDAKSYDKMIEAIRNIHNFDDYEYRNVYVSEIFPMIDKCIRRKISKLNTMEKSVINSVYGLSSVDSPPDEITLQYTRYMKLWGHYTVWKYNTSKEISNEHHEEEEEITMKNDNSTTKSIISEENSTFNNGKPEIKIKTDYYDDKKVVIMKSETAEEYQEVEKPVIAAKFVILENDTFAVGNKTLFRIKAIRDFGNVHDGDIGGYVESEKNLSHEGDCWIYNRACVYGDAMVAGSAKVADTAEVYDHAFVTERAIVCGASQVHGDASVRGIALIKDFAHISGHACVTRGTVEVSAGVFGSATVDTNGHIFGSAKVSGKSLVMDGASVGGNAVVTGNATIMGRAIIGYNAFIDSRYQYITIGPMSNGDYVTFYKGVIGDKKEICVMDSYSKSEYPAPFSVYVENIDVRDEEKFTLVRLIESMHDSLLKDRDAKLDLSSTTEE